MRRELPATSNRNTAALYGLVAGASGLFLAGTVPAGTWTELGPKPIVTGPFTGRISSLAVSASNPDRLFIAGASGGIWRTSDGGASFVSLGDQLPTTVIGALALDPGNEDVLYAGSGEANYANHSLYGLGLFKSADGGDTWQVLAAESFAGRTFAKIIVSPADGGTVYAAIGYAGGFPARVSAKGHPLAEGPVGVFRSLDGGVTWSHLTNGLPAVAATDLVMHPTDSNVLYAAIGAIFGHVDNGVYKSVDAGDSWIPMGGFTNPLVGRISIALAPSLPDRMYALVTVPSQADGGAAQIDNLYRSDNGGMTWTPTNPGNAVQATYGWYLSTVAVHPTSPDTFLFGGLNLLRSTNGGASYQTVTPPHVDMHALAYDANGALWCGNDGGLHKTTNNGTNWTAHNNGLGIVQFYPGISLHPTQPDFVIGGTQDNGTVRRTSGGTAWSQVLGGDGGITGLHPSNPTNVFAEVQGTGNIYRSINGGVSFNFSGTGINTGDRNCFLPPYVFSPSSPSTIFYATHRIYRSTTTGGSWSAISADLTSGSPYAVRALAIAPSNDLVLYAATNDGRISVSSDGGVTWTVKQTGLPGWRRVTRELAVDPLDEDIAYVSVARFGVDQVLRSSNRGDTWSAMDGDLPDIPANTIAVHHPVMGKPTVFVGTDAGVYMTCDEGQHWRKMGLGLPNSPVLDLRVDTVFQRLVAATLGRGAWAVPLPGTADQDGDGHTDMQDFLGFQQCFSGSRSEPGFVAPSIECRDVFDLDFDDDVDVADYICVGERLGGP